MYSSSPTNFELCLSNAEPARFFVNTSDVMLSPETHTVSMIPASFNSLKKYFFTYMCLVLPPIDQLWTKLSAPLLSTLSFIGNFTFNPIEFMIRIINSISCAHMVAEYSSALVIDNATIDISLLFIATGASYRNINHPFALFLLLSFAYYESLIPPTIIQTLLYHPRFPLASRTNPYLVY